MKWPQRNALYQEVHHLTTPQGYFHYGKLCPLQSVIEAEGLTADRNATRLPNFTFQSSGLTPSTSVRGLRRFGETCCPQCEYVGNETTMTACENVANRQAELAVTDITLTD